MYACDFVGHKTAAASKYRMPKPPLERRSVGNADRVGDGMVIAVKGWMEVTSSCALLNFVSLFFGAELIMYTDQMEKKPKKGDGYRL
jgi:hypothetical protein